MFNEYASDLTDRERRRARLETEAASLRHVLTLCDLTAAEQRAYRQQLREVEAELVASAPGTYL